MRKILVIAERSGAELDESALELLGAARALGDVEVGAVLLGSGVAELAGPLAAAFDAVHVFDDPRLDSPTGDTYARVLAPLVQREKPLATLIPHTNVGMELAPVLAVRVGAPAMADLLQLGEADGRLTGVRAPYAGKLHARVSAAPGEFGVVATLRPGAFAAVDPGEKKCEASAEEVPADLAVRVRHVETVAPDAGAVDIRQAELLVAVGRGIEDEENLEMVQSLAEALAAEVACTRPVVDKGWLEKTRQVGTSGASVKPKAYLAVGISGSFQHLGGIKGKPFMAAINKDPAAPIFGVADVGIVGDLFDLVPLLEEKIRERKG